MHAVHLKRNVLLDLCFLQVRESIANSNLLWS